MKPAHLSKDAGQVVNVDKQIQTLSDYIKQVQMSEKPPLPKTFDQWINEPYAKLNDQEPALSRAFWWSNSEIEAARLA